MLGTSEPPTDTGPVLTSADLTNLVDHLRHVDHNAPDAELINQITALERIKSACAAAQAQLTLTFVTSQTAGLTQRQQRDAHAHRSIHSQIALARHDSPARGGRHVGAAKALLREMPHTYQSLRTGEISEYRATLIIRETACLSVEHRGQVDAELAGTLTTMGDKHTANAAARIAQRLDPESCVERNRKALSERRVSIRPAPDTMTYLSALLSVAHGVAVYAALNQHASNAKATGDARSHAQLMADELVHRVTDPTAAAANATAKAAAANTAYPPAPKPADQAAHDTAVDENTAPTPENEPADQADPAAVPPGVNIDIQLVMTDRTLFDGDNEPAILIGHGPIPAPIARHLIRTANPQLKAWIRRLYTDPDTGHLINGDAKRRDFSFAARQFLIARDHTCRTPWCDAPIRHNDHVTGHANGGPTRISNARGTCEACNYTKEAPGWAAATEPDGVTITLTTPTGHTISNQPPAPPQSPPWHPQNIDIDIDIDIDINLTDNDVTDNDVTDNDFTDNDFTDTASWWAPGTTTRAAASARAAHAFDNLGRSPSLLEQRLLRLLQTVS